MFPDVPAGAHLPSRLPSLSLPSFIAPGGNIGCSLADGVARCDIANRVWSPPPKPSRCLLDWAQGMEVGNSVPGQFVCAGDSVLYAPVVVPDGRDDTVGSLTCQVRQFGVTCFDTDGHGFSVSRTGYTTF